MPEFALSHELVERCRKIWLVCEEFQTDPSLSDLFITTELRPFQAGLPRDANQPTLRVGACLAYLVDKRLRDGSSVLPLFISTLRDRYSPDDARYGELDNLGKDIQEWFHHFGVNAVIGLPILDLRSKQDLEFNQKSLQASQRTEVADETESPDEWEFKNREQIQDDIFNAEKNFKHIELFGPNGMGKTHLLKHLSNIPETCSVYIDLKEHLDCVTPDEVLRETVKQLRARVQKPLPPQPIRFYNLVEAINDLPLALRKHIMFMFDSIQDNKEHQQLIKWLVSPSGLINNPELDAAFSNADISEEAIRLQVIIATRQPMVEQIDLRPDVRYTRIPIKRLTKTSSIDDPIKSMLEDLARARNILLRNPKKVQALSDEIYFITGGHPKCAKSVLLAAAQDKFIFPLDKWNSKWESIFKRCVYPTILGEVLGSLPDPKLLNVFLDLSLFRRFDQRLLSRLFEYKILAEFPNARDYADQARALRVQLDSTYLITTSESTWYYTMDYTVRRVLSLYMQYSSPNRCREIHSVALGIFAARLESAEADPVRSLLCLIEIVYHWFKSLEMNPDVDRRDISTKVQDALKTYLALWFHRINFEDRSLALTQFLKHWKDDAELEETARRVTGGTECHKNLSDEIEQFVLANKNKETT